jgi:hypothetical protein
MRQMSEETPPVRRSPWASVAAGMRPMRWRAWRISDGGGSDMLLSLPGASGEAKRLRRGRCARRCGHAKFHWQRLDCRRLGMACLPRGGRTDAQNPVGRFRTAGPAELRVGLTCFPCTQSRKLAAPPSAKCDRPGVAAACSCPPRRDRLVRPPHISQDQEHTHGDRADAVDHQARCDAS